jgi:putative membrane protein
MKRFGLLSIALATAVTVACNGNGRSAANGNANTDTSQSTVGTTGDVNRTDVSNKDKKFVSDMLADGNAEIELGKMAEQKGASPQVKRFGRMMVEDHTKAGDQLKRIAASYNIQPDTSKQDDKHKDLMDKLSKLQGRDFDREYMSAMVDDHSDAVDKLESRTTPADHGATGTTGTLLDRSDKDTNVKPDKADNRVEASVNQWAADTLPTVRHHLDEAKQIEAQIDNNRRQDTARSNAPRINDTRSGKGNKAKY